MHIYKKTPLMPLALFTAMAFLELLIRLAPLSTNVLFMISWGGGLATYGITVSYVLSLVVQVLLPMAIYISVVEFKKFKKPEKVLLLFCA